MRKIDQNDTKLESGHRITKRAHNREIKMMRTYEFIIDEMKKD